MNEKSSNTQPSKPKEKIHWSFNSITEVNEMYGCQYSLKCDMLYLIAVHFLAPTHFQNNCTLFLVEVMVSIAQFGFIRARMWYSGTD